MNKDQVKGAVRTTAGRLQESAGQLVRSKELQVKGLKKQHAGKAESTPGDTRKIVRDTGDRL